MMHLVFVYGTLKRNQPNHWLLQNNENGNVTFKFAAETVTSYPLVIAGRYNIPFLLDVKDKGHVRTVLLISNGDALRLKKLL